MGLGLGFGVRDGIRVWVRVSVGPEVQLIQTRDSTGPG